MYVNEIMTAEVKTCTPDSNLEEIARFMWDYDCGSIPVVNQQGRPIGMVTDRDIAMCAMLNHRPLWEIQASQLIQGQRLCCATQEETVEDCLTKMEQNGVRRCLVVDLEGRLNGIVSMGDAVAFIAGARSRKGVPTASLLDMMRHVSAHHAAPAHPVTQVQ